MIFFRRVAGESMKPNLQPGQIIVGSSRGAWHVGDIVVARYQGREIIKRVTKSSRDQVWLAGDNPDRSTDSRHFGAVNKRDILGGMKYTVPVSQDAPKLRGKYGAVMGLVAAAIMIGFAVLHLFRIDTFVPELVTALGGNRTLAGLVGGSIVTAEVFAIPFLLRIRLSVLAQYVSGALGVAVPLFWSLLAIWLLGTPTSTAQLGEFVALPSTWLLVVADIAWLLFAYVTLWSLGYDHRPHEKQSFVTKLLSRLSK